MLDGRHNWKTTPLETRSILYMYATLSMFNHWLPLGIGTEVPHNSV